MSDEPSTIIVVIRERKTEERVRAMDAMDIVEWIHRLEDEAEAADAKLDRAVERFEEIRDDDTPLGSHVAHTYKKIATAALRELRGGGE